MVPRTADSTPTKADERDGGVLRCCREAINHLYAHILELPQPAESTKARGRPTPVRTRSSLAKVRDAVMITAIRQGFKGLAYCRYLHDHGIFPPVDWISDNCPRNYPAAYQYGAKWQKRIQDEKHRASRKLQRLEENNPGELASLLGLVTRRTRS